MYVVAIGKFQRLSATKARDFARELQGLPVNKALQLTQFSPRKAAMVIGKTLRSAVANAVTNNGLSEDELLVEKAVVDEGPRMKRFWPRARGSARPIQKRLCHIKVILTDGRD